MIKPYLRLTKPGIIKGNLVAAVGGFFLASQGQIDWFLCLVVCVGTTCVVASGCVFNNYIDRDIDGIMKRTLIGFFTLFFFTSDIAFLFAVIGFVIYVGLYSLHYKRKSVHGTLIGGLSGACPPVIGYCAVTEQFDLAAATLFLTFCIWQIPHSYAIAIYRFDDYKSAVIPVLPIKVGIARARYHIMGYIVAFAIASLTLSYLGYAGSWYALGMGLLSLYWLYVAKVGFQKMSTAQWGKQVMLLSIICIMAFCLLISIDFSHPDLALNTLASLPTSLL